MVFVSMGLTPLWVGELLPGVGWIDTPLKQSPLYLLEDGNSSFPASSTEPVLPPRGAANRLFRKGFLLLVGEIEVGDEWLAVENRLP